MTNAPDWLTRLSAIASGVGTNPGTNDTAIVRRDDITSALQSVRHGVAVGNIKTPCPTCGGTTLFIGYGGYLTCSLIGCANPSVGKAIDELKQKADRLTQVEARIQAVDDLIAAVLPSRQQVVDRPHVNAAGQRYAFASARDAVEHNFIPPSGVAGYYDGAGRETTVRTLDDGRSRCTIVDTASGRQCTAVQFHADSMNPSPHTFEVGPISVPRESPDDATSSRRRGSAGNWAELNEEITGAWCVACREGNHSQCLGGRCPCIHAAQPAAD